MHAQALNAIGGCTVGPSVAILTLQCCRRTSMTASQLGAQKNGVEYRSPSVRFSTLCSVDLRNERTASSSAYVTATMVLVSVASAGCCRISAILHT